MSTEVTVAVITASIGVATIAGNILVGRWNARSHDRTSSGTIGTSEAAQLWAESNALRQEYKDLSIANAERASKYEKQLEEVNVKLLEVTTQLTELQAQNTRLEVNGDAMIAKIEELKAIIQKLTKENEELLQLRDLGGTK